jgi:protein O-GlcNAc transferase
MKIKMYHLGLMFLLVKQSFSQSNVDNCNRAIEMLNKNKIDSCDYYLRNAGYYDGNYVNDKSDCFTPFNTAKEKKYLLDLEKDPKDGKAAGSVAIADYWLKKYDEAVKYYDLAISLDPKTEWYYTNLSYLYSNKLNNPAKADEAKELFLKNNPDSDNYTNAASKCFENKEYPKAIVYFKKALIGSTIDHKAYNNIGMSFQRLEKCDSAIFYSTKSIELNPDYRNAAENLTEAYNCQLGLLKMGSSIKEFIELYNKAIQQSLNKTNYPFNISSNLKYPITKYYEAVKELAVKPTSEGYCKFGEYLMSERDFGGAKPMLQKAIDMNPKNGEALFKMASIIGNDDLTENPDYDKAISYFSSAIPSLPDVSISGGDKKQAYYNIGYCNEKKKDYKNAILAYKKGVALNPNNAKDLYSRLSVCCEAIGDTQNALNYKRLSY